MLKRPRAAIGFRVHSGWAALSAVTGSLAKPQLLLRRRLELTNRSDHSQVQPYHAAAEMEFSDAEPFLAECAQSAAGLARIGIEQTLADLEKRGYRTERSGLLLSSGRMLGTLAAILASHPAIHTAEGEFFRDAIRRSAESLGLAVTAIREKELLSRAGEVLGVSPDEACRHTAQLGKLVGPPWRQDERYAAIAAWLSLL